MTDIRRRCLLLVALIICGTIIVVTYSLVVYFNTTSLTVPLLLSSWSPERGSSIENELFAPVYLHFNKGKPSFWDQFVKWHGVKYCDPRLEQVDSWVLQRMFRQGFTDVTTIDKFKYGPRDVRGTKYLERKYALVQLYMTE